MAILAIDVGTSMVGILTDRRRYRSYHRANNEVALRRALKRIMAADVVVAFLGDKFNDLQELGMMAGLRQPVPLQGQCIDMREKCWEHGYFGKGLRDIYAKRFGSLPDSLETYEGDLHRDCLMTMRLYLAYCKGTLSLPN